MNVINDIFKETRDERKGVISIGFFDSLHLGHKKIISELLEVARSKDLVHYVLTYDQLPVKKNHHEKILTLEDKLVLLGEAGVENILLCHYTAQFKHLQPDDFLNLLKENYHISDFVVASDFHFGINKSGTVKNLYENNFNVHLVEPYRVEGEKVSTSSIKEYVKAGKLLKVKEFLGRNYSLDGVVTKGKQLGRVLGFPTMNIYNEEILYPCNGVYITRTQVEDQWYDSMTYVADEIVETNLIGYDKFEYNFKIRVDFFEKIRDNQSFHDLDELKVQLQSDLEKTKCFFGL